jgi:plasmid stabilization system protein ParE
LVNEEPDEPARYIIEYTDAAAEEIARAYLFQSQAALGPEAANLWIRNLRARVDELTTFPRRNERAPEYLNDTVADVRRLLVQIVAPVFVAVLWRRHKRRRTT